jgi:phosphatidylserine/phosphatidylglycerophosphate/cardiolipin synthase-like enzyme
VDAHRRILELAAEVVSRLSAGQADALAADIEVQPSPRCLTHVAGLRAPAEVEALTTAWEADASIDGRELATAIRCAAIAVRVTASYEKVELIYTGPDLPDIRRNSQALLEVVRSARERLWIASYTLFGVDAVLAAMEERADAGVLVSVIVDHLVGPDPESKATKWAWVSGRLAEAAPSCRLLTWPADKRPMFHGHPASLHAKCAVADARQSFVSSANLTDAALERNLEVGYLVTGGTSPRQLDAYFTRLVTRGDLVAVPASP